MYELISFLGVGPALGRQIVNAINTFGTAAIVFSIVGSILSAGSLSWAAASVDFIIYTVKRLLKNSYNQALLW